MSSFNESDRYQLEAARPRRSRSELVFNVFDYVAKDVDLTDYLQPSNLRPFGSNDNIYLPLLMSHKNLNLTTENNPEYLQSIGDLENPEQDNSKVEEDVTRKKTEPIQSNAVNKIKETQYKNSKPYKEIIGKHKELNPLFIPTPKIEKNHATLKKLKEKPQVSQNATHNEKVSKKNKTPSERYEPPVPKSSIAIEPPPFLTKREDMFPTISFVDMGLGTKRNMANYRRMQTPFPAYSDHVKNMAKKHLTDYLDGLKKDNHNNDVDTQESTQRKQSTVQAHNINTIKVKTVDDKPKALKKHEMIKNNVPQRRALSTEHAYSNINASPSSTTVSKPAKSSIYTSNSLNKNPVTQSLISLNTRRVNLSSSQSYAKSSANVRKFEPKPCKTPEKRKRCFLPSKVRLKPPKCITKHYEDCVPKSDCPPRADDCLRFCPKKLPPLKDDDCKCFEPEIPSQNPKLKRLAFKFFDEPRTPRVCPCEPVKCPCPPPPRADELTKPKEKKLPVYVPGYCECIERPPMTNAPLIRLKKVVCEPEERCWPKKVCVVEKCEEKERADDCLVEYVKPLPLLTMGDCSCTEAMMPNENPKMRRLNFEYEDPPRVCPCETPCECPEPPVRADDCLEEKTKKLPAIEVKECACIEPPPMIDVPLKRLKKVCIPEEVCRPKRECPVEPCECKFRADMCLEEEAKKLPKLEPTGCECFEPHVPNQNPKLKRLHMKFVDEPRICPCEPTKCPCPPPPPRSDELAPPKQKKLPVHVPDECKCVERPPMIDIPLIRLKKVCEPEDRCWPKKPCVVEEKCEMKERADDYLCERPKSLRPIQLKPCPCIDLKLKEAPKLKRLSFSVPEPPRICPIEVCPPPPEKCTRADDCAPQKVKQLRAIKLGDCPCVDHPMTDVKPLPRLKCKEDPEECHCEDPCLEYPRADWGCWEYLQDVEPPDKCDKNKEKVYLNYKQKRKFNTDCRVSIQNSIKVKDVGYQMLNSSSKWNLNSEIPKKDLKQRENKPLQDNKVSHIPRNININKTSTLKSTKTAKTEENDKTHITKLGRLHRNNSLPTLFLLKELNKMEKNTKNSNLKHGKSKKSDSTSIFTKLTQNSLVSSSMRNLSTVVTDAKKTTSCYLGAAPASSDRNKNHKDAQETNVYGKKTYLKITKSLANPIAARNCPPKEQRTCVKKRIPVCCEKKQTPNLSFSECMDEEIEPFSNNSQWSCGKKEYGFEPKPKHLNEPLDTVKEKKKLSTSAAHGENTTSDLQLLNGNIPFILFSLKRLL